VFGVQFELGRQLGTSPHVICEHVGGGFGSKFSAGREGVLGATLARDAGAPVRLMARPTGGADCCRGTDLIQSKN